MELLYCRLFTTYKHLQMNINIHIYNLYILMYVYIIHTKYLTTFALIKGQLGSLYSCNNIPQNTHFVTVNDVPYRGETIHRYIDVLNNCLIQYKHRY